MTVLPPGEGPSPGRRDNGLPSAEWGALVDLDPRLSEALLDSLAAEGVAAFVEPARDVDTYTRATVLPKRPLDRLWVNPELAELARGVVSSEVADLTALLAEQEPGMTAHGLVRPVPRAAAARVLPPPELPDPPARPGSPAVAGAEPLESSATGPVVASSGDPDRPSDDELFRQIVAGFADEVSDPVPRWPVSEDLDRARPRRRADPVPPPTDEGSDDPPPRRRRTDSTSDEALPRWIEPAALEDDGHYEPPPPPPVPRLRLRTVTAVLMSLVGLVLLFAPFRVGLSDDIVTMLFGLVLLSGGAALLVAWMRDAPPTDSGPDDGAVV